MIKNVVILLLAIGLAFALFWKWPQETSPRAAPAPPPGTIVPQGPSHPPDSPSANSVAEAPKKVTPLDQILIDAEQSTNLRSSAIGFCLLDESGAVVAEHNARTAFIPASTLKTVTSATALELLGPDFRFTTELRTAAEAGETQSVVKGDVVLVGGGDPTLSLEELPQFVRPLLEKGITSIEGGVIGDGSFFEEAIFDDFWNWGDVGNGYGSPVSGLNLNHNRFVARFRAGERVGAAAAFLGAIPDVPGVSWKSLVKTGPSNSGDGVMIYGGEHASAIKLSGTIPLGSGEFQVVGAAPDPPLFAAHHLAEALRSGGINISGSPASGQSPEETQLLASHRSAPLIHIITHLHKVSDNHETECLFKLLGKRLNRPPAEVIREHWKSRGLEFSTLRMEDGSGLARANFICPRDLARLQQLAAAGPFGDKYRNSLLARYQGAARWKGGAMSGVRAYTGLVKNKSGKEYGFALMVNHYEDSNAVSELREALMKEVMEGDLGEE